MDRQERDVRSSARRSFQVSHQHTWYQGTCVFSACSPFREGAVKVKPQHCKSSATWTNFNCSRVRSSRHPRTGEMKKSMMIWMIHDRIDRAAHRLDRANASTGDHRCRSPNFNNGSRHAIDRQSNDCSSRQWTLLDIAWVANAEGPSGSGSLRANVYLIEKRGL